MWGEGKEGALHPASPGDVDKTHVPAGPLEAFCQISQLKFAGKWLMAERIAKIIFCGNWTHKKTFTARRQLVWRYHLPTDARNTSSFVFIISAINGPPDVIMYVTGSPGAASVT